MNDTGLALLQALFLKTKHPLYKLKKVPVYNNNRIKKAFIIYSGLIQIQS